jgi:hypothetical protein
MLGVTEENGMPFVVIARGEKNEPTASHEQAPETCESALRLIENGTSHVAIEDEQEREYSSGEFAVRYRGPVGGCKLGAT